MPELNPTQFARVEDLFFAARELPADDRPRFLADACGDDAAVRAEVERMLACDVPETPNEPIAPLLDRLAATRDLERASARRADAGPAPESRVGTKVGPYELTSVRGRGGMGVVYQARDSRLGRHVAVKALSPAVGVGTAGLARLLREAKLLASLSHPNIATVFGLEESAGEHFLVMELLDGQSLAQRLRDEGALPVPEAVRLCAGIAAAVDAAHAAGIIHRDLKPGNVMFTADGRPKVLDFGLAREVPSAAGSRGRSLATRDAGAADERPADRITRDGAVMGTPGYMSPEQLRGQPVDRRTDVFALGCVLYECLTGRVAFPGDTFADASAAVLQSDPDWTALPPAAPPPLRRLLRRCLTKEADHRLRDMGDVRLELEEVLAAPPEPAATVAPPRDGRLRTALLCVASAAAAVALVNFVLPPRPAGEPPAATRRRVTPTPTPRRRPSPGRCSTNGCPTCSA